MHMHGTRIEKEVEIYELQKQTPQNHRRFECL
jgi:hypothetical protein